MLRPLGVIKWPSSMMFTLWMRPHRLRRSGWWAFSFQSINFPFSLYPSWIISCVHMINSGSCSLPHVLYANKLCWQVYSGFTISMSLMSFWQLYYRRSIWFNLQNWPSYGHLFVTVISTGRRSCKLPTPVMVITCEHFWFIFGKFCV